MLISNQVTSHNTDFTSSYLLQHYTRCTTIIRPTEHSLLYTLSRRKRAFLHIASVSPLSLVTMAPQNPTLTLDTSSPIGTFFRFLSRYKWTDLDRSKWPSTGESNRWRSRPMLLVGISSESGKLGWYEVVMMTSRPNVREKGPGNYVAICPFPTLVRLVHDRLRLTNGGRLGMSSNGESFAVLDSRTPYPTHLFTPMYPNDDSLNAQYRLSNASLLVIQRLIRDREGAVRRVLPSPLPPPQEVSHVDETVLSSLSSLESHSNGSKPIEYHYLYRIKSGTNRRYHQLRILQSGSISGPLMILSTAHQPPLARGQKQHISSVIRQSLHLLHNHNLRHHNLFQHQHHRLSLNRANQSNRRNGDSTTSPAGSQRAGENNPFVGSTSIGSIRAQRNGKVMVYVDVILWAMLCSSRYQ